MTQWLLLYRFRIANVQVSRSISSAEMSVGRQSGLMPLRD